MKLRRIAESAWRVVAIEEDDGTCQVLEVLGEGVERGDADARAMLARISRVAEQPVLTRNKQQCRPLKGSKNLYELKAGALRVFWFYYGRMMIVCAEVHEKTKASELRRQIQRSEELRERLLAAGSPDEIEIVD